MVPITPAMLDAPLADDYPVGVRAFARPGAIARFKIGLSIYEDLAAIERDWRSFEARADGTVFQTYEWLSTWYRHIGVRRNVRLAIVVGRDARGDMVMLLPLAVECTAFDRRLGWLGSDLCDYNAPLLARDFSRRVGAAHFEQVWAEVVARLKSHPRLGFDWIQLDQMPETIGPQQNPMLHVGVVPHPDRAYAVTLTDTWERIYARRSSSTRRHDRAKRNKLGEYGTITLLHAVKSSEIAGTLETLMSQKERWFAAMGIGNLFAKPGYREFFFDIATNPDCRHLSHVCRLEIGNTVAATSFGLTFGNRFYHILSSYDRDADSSKYGPGLALLHDLLRLAKDRGFEKFDLSVGIERYKHEWSDTELKLYDHVSATNVRGACAMMPSIARRQAKLLINSNPLLRDLYRKACVYAGSLRSVRR